MLDSTTKRKINNARDILVGKIPMPTSQVEQITLALIYKFMSDMDKKSEALGDTSGFFANGYEKYSWGKLMDKSMPARDRVKLYGEGLDKMSTNPHIPQLFRNIFKNAFLPFNDPETLKLFLDQIDQFNYDHSEELGNAFEYLLSSMSSQGDAGQFRTPRHIIDFIVKIVDPKKTDRILDPACGTAGFLISAYKHLVENGLESKELKNVSKNFVGYDISHDMVRLSLVNLYLHHFPDPHVYEYDTLTSEDRWDEDFDVILANPPFMTPKGGMKPHGRFSVPSKKAEVLFTDYIMEHLSINGKAGVIVPEGIIFQSQNAYKNLRKMMIDDDYLWAVISLPSGVFNPYSGVKTSILLFDKILAKKTNKILFVKVENDGYDLGAQRRKISKNNLPKTLDILNNYKKAIVVGKEFEIENNDFSHLVEKAKIRESGDWNLSGERYKENNKTQNSDYKMVELGEIVEMINGRAFKKSEWSKSGLPIIRIGNLNNKNLDFNYFDGNYKSKILVKNNDLLFSWSGSKGTSFGPHIWNSNHGLLNQHIYKFIIKKQNVDSTFLFYMLKGIVSDIEKQAHGGVGLVHITKTKLVKFKIPLPPLSVQHEIVEELDRYQKIIDGARQVVDNYQPEFEIENNWPFKKLGDISEFKNGLNFSKRSDGEAIKILGVGNFKNNLIAPLSELKEIQVDRNVNDSYLLKKGDIVFVRSNGNKKLVGRSVVISDIKERVSFSGFTIRCRLTNGIKPMYIGYLLKSKSHSDLMKNIGRGANIRNISQGILSNISIPIPPIEIQKQIIHKLQEEQKIIKANQFLIENYKEKIRSKIDKIWNK